MSGDATAAEHRCWAATAQLGQILAHKRLLTVLPFMPPQAMPSTSAARKMGTV